MASKPQSHAVAAPQHFAPPTARELRAQSVHRLQAGLIGLCAVLLIVGLANIIMDRARLTEVEYPSDAATASDEPAHVADPLADIGVAPAANSSAGVPHARQER